jgi:hypothetical protein
MNVGKVYAAVGCLVGLLPLVEPARADADGLDIVFDSDFEAPAASRYEVGVVIELLGTRTASFQLNDGKIVTATSDGGFCFSDMIRGDEAYQISVTQQPEAGLACAADEPIGLVTGTVRVTVTCNLTRTDWNEFSWDDTHWN